jgi:hypothetical protein
VKRDYSSWLRARGYDEGTITAQLHRSSRVEKHHGDLDRHFEHDRLEGVLSVLRYSTEDQRRGRANPTRIPINGDLRTNLASYRNAVVLYRRFLDGEGRSAVNPPGTTAPIGVAREPPSVEPSARLGRSSRPAALPPEQARTLLDFGLDGQAALEALIATSRYRTVAQAIASLTLFTHPETVAQTDGRALFPTIRGSPGTYGSFGHAADGRPVLLDDNKSAVDAFRWSNQLPSRSRETQTNHVWADSRDPDSYTALANLCLTPAFLAKLTDTNAEIKALLAYRSWDLFGWRPTSQDVPERPAGYSVLEWAPPLPPTPNLRVHLAATFERRSRDRTVLAALRLGWLFGPNAATLELT